MQKQLFKIFSRENIEWAFTPYSILLIIWQISIFRKTFISSIIPSTIFFGGGLIVFILVRKKLALYRETRYNLVWQAIHGIILFGGTLVFLFMALNFYFSSSSNERILNLNVIETGELAKGRHGCGQPYAIVSNNNIQKQLVFPCGTHLNNVKTIKVALKKGLFGFVVVQKMNPLVVTNNEDILKNEYLKILSKAEEYYSEGNIQKSIELYQRASTLNPADKLPKMRLDEIRKQNTTNN